MEGINKKYLFLAGFLIVLILTALSAGFNFVLAAWSEPFNAPPAGNVKPPLTENTVFSGDIGGLYNDLRLTVCTAGQVLEWVDGSGWQCSDGGGNQTLLEVLQAGSDASIFVGNVNVGDATHAANFYLNGGELKAKWIHATAEGNNSIMGNLGIGTTNPSVVPPHESDQFLEIKGANQPGLVITNTVPNRQWGVYVSQGGAFRIADVSGNFDRFVISGPQNSGNVGIGMLDAITEKLIVSDNDNSAGVTARIRINDTDNNPEIQLHYGVGPNEHWSIYNEQTNDSLRIWSDNAGASGNRLTILQSGEVGIGTVSPSAKFEVAGQVKITGGNPDVGKILTSDATGLASWQTPAGGLPTGTSGQTLRHDGATWAANSVIYNNGVNVGINNSNPLVKLDILVASGPALSVGSSNNVTGLRGAAIGAGHVVSGVNAVAIGNQNSAQSSNAIALGQNTIASGAMSTAMGHVTTASGYGSTAMGQQTIAAGNTAVALGFYSQALADYSVAIGTKMKVNSGANYSVGIGLNNPGVSYYEIISPNVLAIMGGNVGMGTVSPGYSLHLQDNDNTAIVNLDNVGVNLWTGVRLARNGSEKWFLGINNTDDKLRLRRTGSSDDLVIDTLGNVGIGAANPGNKLHIKETGGSQTITLETDGSGNTWKIGGNSPFKITRNSNDILNITTSGNVGIGVTAPVYKLDVSGALRLNPSTAPTNNNGVMYYDSGVNKFKCYENGVWKDCVGGLPTGTIGQTLRYDGATWAANSVIYNDGVGIVTINGFLEVKKDLIVGDNTWGGEREVFIRADAVNGSGGEPPINLVIEGGGGNVNDWGEGGDVSIRGGAGSGGSGDGNVILGSLINTEGNKVGIGIINPQSAFHVPDGKYAQFEDNNNGPPPLTDCVADSQRGRLSIDTFNNRLYICNGAARGWDYVVLTN